MPSLYRAFVLTIKISGSTIRLAQSIGLHIAPDPPPTLSNATAVPDKADQGHRLWYGSIYCLDFVFGITSEACHCQIAPS